MRNKVVHLEEIIGGIALVKMEDRDTKNAFSDNLMEDLLEVFKYIDSNENFKVVILTGYDNYFATGGTKETLLNIYEKKIKFSDNNIYSLLIDCKIPVIVAMQGHAVGGGLILGITGDIVIMSRESVYTSNFMKYGFTPGMGATYLLPKKLGLSISQEMLFTAMNYRGAELEKRGIPFKVMGRNEVLDYAIEIAETFIEKPRLSLITLKNHLLSEIRAELPSVIRKELEMHDITFHQSDVKSKIINEFGK